MSSVALAIVMALCGGVAVAVQGPLVSMAGQKVGVLGSVLVFHISGTLSASLLLLLTGWHLLARWQTIPWYVLIGTGATAVVVISAFSLSVPRIGMAATAVLIMASQLVATALLDHLGLLGLVGRPLSTIRLAGVGIVLLGAWMVVR